MAATLAKQHHERWDGQGYPDGLSAKHIMLESRIATLLDAFDALVNKRPYKDAWPVEKVISVLEQEKAQHFDPRLVEYLIDHIDDFMLIQKQYPDVPDYV